MRAIDRRIGCSSHPASAGFRSLPRPDGDCRWFAALRQRRGDPLAELLLNDPRDQLTQAGPTVCSEVTLMRLSPAPVIRTPWTATLCAFRLTGPKNLTPSSWYR